MFAKNIMLGSPGTHFMHMSVNDDKYHRIGRVALSFLEQVLKFDNYTIDDFINYPLKR